MDSGISQEHEIVNEPSFIICMSEHSSCSGARGEAANLSDIRRRMKDAKIAKE
jgi:hypothetical protein